MSVLTVFYSSLGAEIDRQGSGGGRGYGLTARSPMTKLAARVVLDMVELAECLSAGVTRPRLIKHSVNYRPKLSFRGMPCLVWCRIERMCCMSEECDSAR